MMMEKILKNYQKKLSQKYFLWKSWWKLIWLIRKKVNAKNNNNKNEVNKEEEMAIISEDNLFIIFVAEKFVANKIL